MYEKDDTLRIAFPEVQNMDKANRLLNALAEGSKL
jgi:hypothetical protein